MEDAQKHLVCIQREYVDENGDAQSTGEELTVEFDNEEDAVVAYGQAKARLEAPVSPGLDKTPVKALKDPQEFVRKLDTLRESLPKLRRASFEAAFEVARACQMQDYVAERTSIIEKNRGKNDVILNLLGQLDIQHKCMLATLDSYKQKAMEVYQHFETE